MKSPEFSYPRPEFPTEWHLQEARRGLDYLLTRNLLFSYAPLSPDSRSKLEGADFTLRLGRNDLRVVRLGAVTSIKEARARSATHPEQPVLIIDPNEDLFAGQIAGQIAVLTGAFLVASALKRLTDRGQITDWQPYRPESSRPSPNLIHPTYEIQYQNSAPMLIGIVLDLPGFTKPYRSAHSEAHPIHLITRQTTGHDSEPLWASDPSIEQTVMQALREQ